MLHLCNCKVIYACFCPRLHSCCGVWEGGPCKPHQLVAVVIPTDRPTSVRNRCVIELFCSVVRVVALPFWHFCWWSGFCHRTESDLFLFVFNVPIIEPTRVALLTVIPRNRTISVAFYDAHWDTGDLFLSWTPSPHGQKRQLRSCSYCCKPRNALYQYISQ